MKLPPIPSRPFVPDPETSRLLSDIVGYIRTRGALVTFAELGRNVSGFKGNKTLLYEDRNIVLWADLSVGAVEALQSLMEEELICLNGASILTYLNDGITIDLPIASPSVARYTRPHWWPTTLSLSDKGRAKFTASQPSKPLYFEDDECVKISETP